MKPAPRTRNAIASAATQERRAHPPSSPPKTRVPPATIRAISDIERASGPVNEEAILLSGVSHGRPPPAPAAKADCVAITESITRKRSLFRLLRVRSIVTSRGWLKVLDGVTA